MTGGDAITANTAMPARTAGAPVIVRTSANRWYASADAIRIMNARMTGRGTRPARGESTIGRPILCQLANGPLGRHTSAWDSAGPVEIQVRVSGSYARRRSTPHPWASDVA